jgi:hypothetical protein
MKDEALKLYVRGGGDLTFLSPQARIIATLRIIFRLTQRQCADLLGMNIERLRAKDGSLRFAFSKYEKSRRPQSANA